MPCLVGQVFDPVRGQCISCSDACPPGRDQDNYCVNHCPRMLDAQTKGISRSVNTTTILLIITPIVVIAVILIILFVYAKRRRQHAGNSVETRSRFERQRVDEPLSPRSNEEPESNPNKSIRIGGLPEENADPASTQFVPN